jgi:exonuclease III
MLKWIMCPRTHDPARGNSPPPSSSTVVSVDKWVGDEFPPHRESGSTRVYFVNANGIWYGTKGGKMNEVCARVLEGNIDIIGIAETKLDTNMACVIHTCHQSVQRHFDNSKLIMASSTRSYGSTYKVGGTLQLSRGSITGRVVASGTDGMGRWCWATYNGSANRRVMVITAYQVCEGVPVHDVTLHRVTKKYSAGTQQHSMMIERGYPTSRTPRTQFKLNLKTLLEGFLNQHHEILLMGDFNEDLETGNDGLRSATMGLIDLMQVKIGHQKFSTHIDGRSRIDFVFATPRVVEACTHAGYESFRHRFETDHRGFFLDLETAVLFGNEQQ